MLTAAILFMATALVGTGIAISEMGPGEKMNPLVRQGLVIAGALATLFWLLVYFG